MLTVSLPALAGNAAGTHGDTPTEDHVYIREIEQSNVYVWCDDDIEEGVYGCAEDLEALVGDVTCTFERPPCALQPEYNATVVVLPAGDGCYDCPGVYATVSQDGAWVGYGAYYWCETGVSTTQGIEDCFGVEELVQRLLHQQAIDLGDI